MVVSSNRYLLYTTAAAAQLMVIPKFVVRLSRQVMEVFKGTPTIFCETKTQHMEQLDRQKSDSFP